MTTLSTSPPAMELVTPTPLEHSLSVSHLNLFAPPVKWYPPGTRVLIVEVEELEGEVVVRCVFRHTLSQRCYVQLVSSEVEGGFQEGGCVEGEGEGVHRFPGLLPVTYTVLVYGLAAGGGVDSCSPAPGDPDYITVATVHGPHPSSVNNQPSPTNKMTSTSILSTKIMYGISICVHLRATCYSKSLVC